MYYGTNTLSSTPSSLRGGPFTRGPVTAHPDTTGPSGHWGLISIPYHLDTPFFERDLGMSPLIQHLDWTPLLLNSPGQTLLWYPHRVLVALVSSTAARIQRGRPSSSSREEALSATHDANTRICHALHHLDERLEQHHIKCKVSPSCPQTGRRRH